MPSALTLEKTGVKIPFLQDLKFGKFQIRKAKRLGRL